MRLTRLVAVAAFGGLCGVVLLGPASADADGAMAVFIRLLGVASLGVVMLAGVQLLDGRPQAVVDGDGIGFRRLLRRGIHCAWSEVHSISPIESVQPSNRFVGGITFVPESQMRLLSRVFGSGERFVIETSRGRRWIVDASPTMSIEEARAIIAAAAERGARPA